MRDAPLSGVSQVACLHTKARSFVTNTVQVRRPYKDLIESYAKVFNSQSLPCSKGIEEEMMPVRMPRIGELEQINMDDYMEGKKADKDKNTNKKEKG